MIDETTDNLPVPDSLSEVRQAIDDYSDKMADTHAWFRDKRRQAHHLALLEQEERLTRGESGGAGETAMPSAEGVAAVRAAYGPAMDGFRDSDIEYMADTLSRILDGLPGAHDLATAFDAADLSPQARRAIFAELARPVLPEEIHMEPEDILNKRLHRLASGLTQADIDAINVWWRTVPQDEAATILERLVTPA